uniref:Uncharacterized protein n=1 Tax=Scleropages formosus TaxID=113540 RepID=A0A8C9W553_SCLFO
QNPGNHTGSLIFTLIFSLILGEQLGCRSTERILGKTAVRELALWQIPGVWQEGSPTVGSRGRSGYSHPLHLKKPHDTASSLCYMNE